MRFFAVLVIIYTAAVGTTSALVDVCWRTTVQVATSGYDERTGYACCNHDGCAPKYACDRCVVKNSCWSCKGDILDDVDEGCWIEYYFDEPQDIVELRIAFNMGTENTWTLNVYDNGGYHSQIASSGDTNGYETFYLSTDETAKLRLALDDWQDNSDVWLSIAEVKIMVE